MTQMPERTELRNFALIVAGMVVLFFGALVPWLWSWRFPAWPWYVAGSLVAWGLAAPLSLRLPHRLWMALGHGLGWVNTRLLLAIIFYLLITPMGLIMRLLGSDPMRRRLDAAAKTYRVESRPLSRNDMETPY